MPFALNRQTLAVLSCFISAAAAAQTSAPVPQLDQVIVTASRTPQLEKNALGDVTVVGKKELQKAGQDSVAEILARQPGIQFASNGGPQTPTGVFLRGANPSQTLVLIDGIRINSSTQGGANWNTIDPATIERIEIVRGAASSLYGSDAIGGVINIISKPTGQDRPLSAWGNVGYGTHGTFKSGLGLSGAQDGWDYALSSSMTDSSGFNATNERNTFSYHPDSDGYTQHSLSGSLGYTWKKGHHVGLTAYNGYTDGDYDAGEFMNPASSVTRQQAYTLTSTDDITDYWQSVLRLGVSKEYIEDRTFQSSFSSLQRSYTWQNNFKLTENQELSTVLERLEERPAHSSAIYSVNRRDTNSAGLVYRGDFSAHHFQASVRNDNISGYGNETTGGLAYSLDLSDQWSIGVGGNTGFRAPTFSDLYSPFAPNPDLQPEKSRNIEFNIAYKTDSTRLGLVAYQNKIRDLITLDPTRNFAAYNIDAATIRGVTLTAEQDYGDTTVRASADLMNPRDDNTGGQLVRRAKQVYRISADHRFKALTVGAEYQLTGKRYDDAANQTSLGGYGLLGLTAAYDFSKNVGVQVRWNNILDKDYTSVYGYNMPGSNVFVNFSFRM